MLKLLIDVKHVKTISMLKLAAVTLTGYTALNILVPKSSLLQNIFVGVPKAD